MTLAELEGQMWLDGEYIPIKQATTHLLTHTLHYGVGCFEGTRAYKTATGAAIFRLKEHTDRLFKSAHILGMKPCCDKQTLLDVQVELLRKNNMQSAYLRPMLYYGSEGLGLRCDNLTVHAMVASWEWGTYLGPEAMAKGIRVKTSSYTRHHPNSVHVHAKANGNYMNSILALQEVRSCGYDEALLLDHQGFVAEGSAENVFVVSEGVLYTPHLTAALAGITRDTIMILAKDLGYRVIERNITRDDIYVADEFFLVGTAAEVTPVRELDGRTIGSGTPGPVTSQLQQLYFDQVQGKRQQYPEWLTYV